MSALPKEIKNIIASFLDDRARRTIRITSTEWFNVINYDDFKIYFASPSTLPDIIQTFSRYSKPIGLQFEKTISIDSTFAALATFTNLTRLEIDSSRYRQAVNKSPIDLDPCHFTALTALQKINIGEDVKFYIEHFPNLTHIDIHGSENSSRSQRQRINPIAKLGKYTRLRSLDVRDKQNEFIFDEESVVKMSSVSKVSIFAQHLSFPFSKLPNLESLSISDGKFGDFSVTTKLTYLSVSLAFNMRVIELSALEQLKYLELNSVQLEEDEYSFFSNLTNLENLNVTRTFNPKLKGQYLQFINSSKLTSLTVTIPGILIAPSSNIDYISHLTSLCHLDYSSSIEENTAHNFKLTNITSLVGYDIKLSKYFPNVKHLYLSQHMGPKEHVKVLGSLTQLEYLHLKLVIDHTALPTIATLTNLTYLAALCRNAYYSCYSFEVMTSLTALKELALESQGSEDKVHGTGLLPALWTLTNLERLSLFHVDFNDELIQTLESLPKLKHLLLNADREEVDELRLSKLTNLQALHRTNRSNYLPLLPWPDCKLIGLLPYLYDCQSAPIS